MKLKRLGTGDLILAVLIVAIIAMMIVPLPPLLLDLLIAVNLALSVVLLLSSTYIHRTIELSTFPAILLVTTLYRLAINISSTRLILLDGNPGQIIQSFGSFVIAGSVLVGAVIFLVLTIVQYVVIAKGAERAAEVSARFTLDALPGRQMAIEADLRSGRLDPESAELARQSLKRESQLFSSLEGAMKFVKGDAIATIVIIAINIVGGILRGVVQLNMSLADAAQTYTLLTIGDGLVSQIPALLITTAAGIVMTRVESERSANVLGREIGLQLLSSPKSLYLASGLSLALALIPGMPLIPFLLVGLFVGALAYGRQQLRDLTLKRTAIEEEPELAASDRSASWHPVAVGFRGIRYNDLLPLRRRLSELTSNLRDRYGLPELVVPLIPFAGSDGLTLLHKGVPVLTVDDIHGAVLAVDRRSELDEARIGFNVISDTDLLVPEPSLDALASTGLASQSALEYLWARTLSLADQNLRDYINPQVARTVLERFATTHGEIAREVESRLSAAKLSRVLQILLAERVSLTNLLDIFIALAEWSQLENDPVPLAQRVRERLKRQLCHQLSGGVRKLPVFVLDYQIQQAIEESISPGLQEPLLLLEPEIHTDIVRAIRLGVEQHKTSAPYPVLLARRDLRYAIQHQLLAGDPQIRVLSESELPGDLIVETVAIISVSTASAQTA